MVFLPLQKPIQDSNHRLPGQDAGKFPSLSTCRTNQSQLQGWPRKTQGLSQHPPLPTTARTPRGRTGTQRALYHMGASAFSRPQHSSLEVPPQQWSVRCQAHPPGSFLSHCPLSKPLSVLQLLLVHLAKPEPGLKSTGRPRKSQSLWLALDQRVVVVRATARGRRVMAWFGGKV